MRHNDVIYLISQHITQDELGNNVTEKNRRLVFANRLSMKSSEYYGAGTRGMLPEKQFEIYAFEYAGESLLEHGGIQYKAVPFEQGEKLRITCEKVVGHG